MKNANLILKLLDLTNLKDQNELSKYLGIAPSYVTKFKRGESLLPKKAQKILIENYGDEAKEIISSFGNIDVNNPLFASNNAKETIQEFMKKHEISSQVKCAEVLGAKYNTFVRWISRNSIPSKYLKFMQDYQSIKQTSKQSELIEITSLLLSKGYKITSYSERPKSDNFEATIVIESIKEN